MSEEWRALGAEAARFLREERWAEAIITLERILALRPDHADSWFNIGYAHRHARHYGAALDAYQKALDLGVVRAEEIHLNRAVILSEHLHRTAEAQAELERAVEINPAFVQAWLNLGNLLEDLGDGDAAISAYSNALRAKPSDGRAIARTATMMAEQGNLPAAVGYLREKAASTRPGSEDQAEVAFALGNLLHDAGDHSAAMATIREANSVAASLRRPEAKYDASAQEHLVDELIAAFPHAVSQDAASPAPTAFICGMFRSGSTLTEQMLARHSKVVAGGELEFVPAMIAEDLQPYPQSVPALSAERIAELSDAYRIQVDALFPGPVLVTDKRPDNFLHIGLVKTLFPSAKIVHTVRNPLDNLLSAYFLYFGESITYSDSLADLTHYYTQYRRLMEHWQKLYGADIFAADYDLLVADPKQVLAPMLDFLGLDWEEACLDGKADSGPVRTASVWQVRRPLHGKSSGRWRHYADELADVRSKLEARGLLA